MLAFASGGHKVKYIPSCFTAPNIHVCFLSKIKITTEHRVFIVGTYVRFCQNMTGYCVLDIGGPILIEVRVYVFA